MKIRLPLLREIFSLRPRLLAPLLAAALPLFAADAPAPASPNVTVNLINRMVERNLLTKEDAADLIRQAEADATAARAAAATTQAEAIKLAVAQALAAQAAAAPAPAAPADGTVRVTYIPAPVREQMTEEIRQEVMAQAVAENWASPRTFPEWVSRFRLFGDVRTRYDGTLYPSGNDNTGAFPNFNAINTGAPFDTSGSVFSPQLNVDQDRLRLRLRARLGAAVDLGEGYSTGLRLATGENNSPVSQNQSLGGASSATQGQGGNFAKYALWLDRAFIKYEPAGAPGRVFSFTAGRFDNPFFSTSMLWADDLGFDGLAVQGRAPVSEKVTPFFTAGLFPVFNTDLNFATIQPAKFKSTDKWLYAVQTGADLTVNKDVNAKLGAAFYFFDGVEGKLSDPFTPLSSADQGNTDNTRPAFAQKGNSYMALRNITPSALNGFGTTNQFQYFGLATPYRDLALTGRLDYNRFAPVQVSLTGEFVKNTAFDRGAISAKAVNNLGAGSPGVFEGGDTAWITTLKVGHISLEQRGDWTVSLGYRHVESDAVVDGFADSDFGGGGTNVRGYTLAGTYALSARTWLSLRWMSSSEIAGPPLKNDILQFDLNAKF
jgi:hypothetical protein